MTILMYRKCCCAVVVGWLFVTGIADGLSQNLKSAGNHADYVIIAPSCYLPLAEQLASFRHLNDGYSTMVVPFDSDSDAVQC